MRLAKKSCFCALGLLLALLLVSPVAVAAPVVSGTSYSVTSLPATGKISAFNGMLVLTYPKDNALVNAYKTPVAEQSVAFTVYLPDGGSPDYQSYVLVSNIFEISVAQGAYLLYPGQLTLSCTTDVSSVVADQLSVWFSPGISVSGGVYKWDGNSNINLGGLADSRKRTVTVPFQFSGAGAGYYGVFLAQRAFEEFNGTDPLGVGWSYPSLMPLWAKGIVEQLPLGRTDNYFGLTTEVNRLEFATMLVKGLGLPLMKRPDSASEQLFKDTFGVGGSVYFYQAKPEDIDSTYFGSTYSTSPASYRIYDASRMPVQYVETAARSGIVLGYADGTFKPANKLTRQEAAVILARVANLKLSDDGEKVKEELAKIFEDADQIAPWAAASVLAAQRAKLIVGKPSSDPKSNLLVFDPNGNLTRAEAVTLSYRLLKKLRKI